MIHVECYADEVLVRALGVARRDIRHEGTKGDVVNAVRRAREGVGLVDEDPGSAQPGDLRNYVVQMTSGSLRCLARRGAAQQRIVVVAPDLETWLLRRATAQRLDPAAFGLPDEPHALHDIPHYERSRNFRGFLDALLAKDSEFADLTRFLSGN